MIMAKGFTETDAQCRQIVQDARNGVFSPVYLLMGDEPYYVDMVCDAVLDHCLDESERDFNQTVCYGADVDADAVVTAARRYPMFAERQLVVVKEAQMMKSLEEIAVYCQNPLESTVLVIAMHGASADKRKSLYKTVSKMGVVVDSQTLRDYEMPKWISMFYKTKGLDIAPDAAALLAEHAGTDLNKIAIETEKMLKNLPEGVSKVSASDIEKNVGISRQFSIFELTKELSYKNSAKALRIAAYLGSSARFAMPMAVSALFTHFNRILKYSALLMMFAQVSGLEPGEFIHVISDMHIYDRHIDMVKEMLEREPLPAAKVRLNPEIKNFYDFTVDDFIEEDYQYHKGFGKIPVAE